MPQNHQDTQRYENVKISAEVLRSVRIESAKTGRLMRDIVDEACQHWLKRHAKRMEHTA